MVLFVGSIFNRRHVIDLVRAFAPIARAHPDASLDIVGDNRSYPHEDPMRAIHAEGLHEHVHWHRYVTDEQLRDLYRRARAFAFLSEYEGLGLTPLEALAAGLPPVLLDTAVARESCGAAALYVQAGRHPRDHPGADDRALRRERTRRGSWRRLRTNLPNTAGPGRHAKHSLCSKRVPSSLTPPSSAAACRDAADDYHRVVQRGTGSRALPRVTHGGATGRTLRDRCRGQRVNRRQRRARPPHAGCACDRQRVQTLASARPITSASAPARSELILLLNSDTIVPDGAIDRLIAELDGHPDVAVVGPRLVDASGRAELSFGPMIGPLNEFRQQWRARGRRRDDYPASPVSGLGQRRVHARTRAVTPKPPVCSMSVTSCTRRTSICARQSEVLGGAFSLHPTCRSSTCVDGLAPAPGRHRPGIPAQPARVLRQTPSRAGCLSFACICGCAAPIRRMRDRHR